MDSFLEKWNFLLGRDDVNNRGFIQEDIENEIVSAIQLKGNIFFYVTYNWSENQRNSLLNQLGLEQINLENDIILKYRYFIQTNREFDSFEGFYRYLVTSGRHYIFGLHNRNRGNRVGWDYVDLDEEHLEVPDVMPINENEVINRRLLFRQFKNVNPFCYRLMFNKYYNDLDYYQLSLLFPEVASEQALRQRMTDCKRRFHNFLVNPF